MSLQEADSMLPLETTPSFQYSDENLTTSLGLPGRIPNKLTKDQFSKKWLKNKMRFIFKNYKKESVKKKRGGGIRYLNCSSKKKKKT